MDKRDLTEVPDLEKIILNLLLQIPEGMVTSYKDVANALGDGAAARAVGTVMANNEEPKKYPCWRVVRSNGEVGNYSASGGREAKIEKMKKEGIEVEEGTIKNFSEVRYDDYEIDPPLPRLREIQNGLERMVKLEQSEPPESVAGVDVSYGPDGAVAAYVEMDNRGEEVVYRKTFREERVKFPYIPGYLAFRELPLLNNLLEEVRGSRGLSDVIFVDGNGLIHPRKAGLATHLGVVLEHPTIGVAKKLLCGEIEDDGPGEDRDRKVRLEEDIVGLEVKTFARANPVYVSVGNRIMLDQAGELTRKVSTYKLPEPIRQAHKAAKSRAT
ncbi:MAG: endonuclease V [Candidatus Bipolaricaulota bacterium]|nr:endonuclease V [Candidatus Bipolaricaulota bacterium]